MSRGSDELIELLLGAKDRRRLTVTLQRGWHRGPMITKSRRWPARMPIWLRVPALIGLVLVAVLVSTMVLDAGAEGGHGSGGQMETNAGDDGRTGPAAPASSHDMSRSCQRR